MTFQIVAVLGTHRAIAAFAAGIRAKIVRLDGERALVPLARPLQAVRGEPVVPGLRLVPSRLGDVAREASRRGALAALEAEFTGDLGAQRAIVWRDGEIALGPLSVSNENNGVPPIREWPINRALRELGVVAVGPRDEFDTLRLGRHRRVEGWLEEPALV